MLTVSIFDLLIGFTIALLIYLIGHFVYVETYPEPRQYTNLTPDLINEEDVGKWVHWRGEVVEIEEDYVVVEMELVIGEQGRRIELDIIELKSMGSVIYYSGKIDSISEAGIALEKVYLTI